MLHHVRQLLQAMTIGVFLVAVGFNVGPLDAQDTPAADAVRTSIIPGGMRRYERGKWSVLTLKASNASDDSAGGSLSVFFENDIRTQFGRRYWVPAKAIRSTWLPVRVPENIPFGQKTLHTSVLNVVGTGDAAILNRKNEGEQLIAETLLALDPAAMRTGMISSRLALGEVETSSGGKDEVYETAVATRLLHNEDRTISNFHQQFLPPFPAAYDALDQIVISNDRIVADSGGLAAIRNWIARGGRAWVMLDLVDIETVRSLLGNAVPYEVVDRVELTEFVINTPESAAAEDDPMETWSAEEPVEFVRVVLDSGKIYNSIDGWPASFSISFGEGEVFFTTLAARGWRYQYDEFSDPVKNSRPTSGPTRALKILADKFNQQAMTQSVGSEPLSDGLKPILMERIGYRVPSRNIAAAILGLSCVLIAVTGIWLARREQLERIAWIIPVGTIIPAIALIAIGSANTSSIPPTSSVLRLANVNSDTNEIHADTLAAFYSPDTVELPLEVDVSSVVTPEMQDLTGVAKRAVWDDNGRGRWEQMEVASGSVRFARAKESRLLDHPLRARATFGPLGLEGQIVGIDQLGGTPSDAIVASPRAPYSDVSLEPTGAFEIGPDDVLSQAEFITDAMLSDRQQRRQAIYREIFAPNEKRIYPRRTTLFVWGAANSLGLKFPELFQQTGSTLFAIPLDIGRTSPKQPFLIPATFVDVSNAAKDPGRSFVFNSETGKWLDAAKVQTQTLLQFSIPRQVLPCRITSALITLKIHAPTRTIDITGIRNGESVVIETRKNPSGVLTLSIDDPELLQLNEIGALQFGVNVSKSATEIEKAAERNRAGDQRVEPYEPLQIPIWKIDYLRVQASGETE